MRVTKHKTSRKLIIFRVSHDLDIIELNLIFPLIKIRSKHIIRGDVQGTPVMNPYFVNVHSTNVKANVIIYGEYFMDRLFDNKYFSVNDVSVRFKSSENEFYITNVIYKKLLSYSETLGVKNIWSTIKSDIILQIEDIASSAVMETANKIYSAFPITTLMPIYV